MLYTRLFAWCRSGTNSSLTTVRNVGAQQILDAASYLRSLVRETTGAVGMDEARTRTRRNARGGGATIAVKDGLATAESLVAQE